MVHTSNGCLIAPILFSDTTGLLLMDMRRDNPVLAFGAACTLSPNLASILHMQVVPTNAAGAWQVQFVVPKLPALQGIPILLQAMFLPSALPWPGWHEQWFVHDPGELRPRQPEKY